MASELPGALAALRAVGRKEGRGSHWAWWAFPTEREGSSEPRALPSDEQVPSSSGGASDGTSSGVSTSTRTSTSTSSSWGRTAVAAPLVPELCRRAPPVWRELLEEVCALAERQAQLKTARLSPRSPL